MRDGGGRQLPGRERAERAGFSPNPVIQASSRAVHPHPAPVRAGATGRLPNGDPPDWMLWGEEDRRS